MKKDTNKWSSALDKLFDTFEGDLRRLSPADKAIAYETLTNEFNKKLMATKNHQPEVEYGQHSEGLYHIKTNVFPWNCRDFL